MLQFHKDLRFNFSPPALIIHQCVPADTDHIRSLPDSQPGTQSHDPQPLTIRQSVLILSAQQGILRLLPTYNSHRTAPEFGISRIRNCFRSCVIANQIKRQLTEVYINEPLETDSEGNTLTIADILSSGVNIEEETELRINSQKLYKFIAEELDEREREIICKRYGIRDGRGYAGKALTQREIAKQLGISRSYISRIEKKTLEKLRKRFEEG